MILTGETQLSLDASKLDNKVCKQKRNLLQKNNCVMNNDPVAIRDKIFLQQLVLVDGQPGCGKAVLDPAVASMERVELLQFSFEIEYMCALRYLGKITSDGAETMIKLQADIALYETMMSRNVNFRLSDQSSAFKDPNFWVYIKRLFAKGNMLIPERIKKERPILHFMTHNLLGLSKPIFNSLGDKVAIIEFVRHPMSMLAQQTLYNEWWSTSLGQMRQFNFDIKYKEEQIPFWTKGYEELYLKSNPVERAIYDMQQQIERVESFKNKFKEVYKSQCITIPFEKFVVAPWPYMERIEALLKTKMNRKTKKMLKKARVPRDNTGIEANELINKRNFAIQNGASKDALRVLGQISEQYEDKYDLSNQKQK